MLIIPTYNEKDNIRPLMKKIRDILPNIKVLFVDDNSPDGTANDIKLLQKTDSQIILLHRPEKLGIGPAYKYAFEYTLKNNLDETIITMDADLSHPVQTLPKMIEDLKNYDLVIGSRYIAEGKVENWNLFRKILSRAGNLYARIITGVNIRDLTAGFMAIRTTTLRQLDLNNINATGYAFLVQLKTEIINNKGTVLEIPITFSERRGGRSKISKGIFIEELMFPLKYFFKKRIFLRGGRILYPIFAFFGSLIFYGFTAPRSIFIGDSPEFISSIMTWGVPHPPGYPAYIILGKLFSLLPLGSLEFRINFFSAFCAAIILSLLFYLLIKIFSLFKPEVPDWIVNILAFIPLVILALSDLFFSQAIMAKPYMLFLLFLALLAILATKYLVSQKNKYLYFSFFLIGLGLGAHQMMIFFGGALALLLIKKLLFRGIKWKPLLFSGICFVIGLANYFYLFIRFSADPSLSWGKENNPLLSTLNYFMRTYYADYGSLINFDLQDKLRYLYSFSYQLYDNFGSLIFFALFGFCVALYLNRKIFFTLLFTILLNVLPVILLRNEIWGTANEEMYYYYYLPAFTAIIIFMGISLLITFWLLTKKLDKVQALVIIVLATVFFSYQNVEKSFAKNNLQDLSVVDGFSLALLSSLEPNAVLISNFEGSTTDTLTFATDYQMRAKKIRPDVSIISNLSTLIKTQSQAGSRRQLLDLAQARPDIANRPIYTTFFPETINHSLYCLPNGFVCKVSTDKQRQFSQTPYNFSIPAFDYNVLVQNYFGQDLLAYIDYMQAAYILPQNQFLNSQNKFIEALKLDNEVAGLEATGYRAYRNIFLKKQ
jgi:dolichol-phosphate mannosyltransferase